MATDGKYLTLAALKQYGLGTIVDPLNPTVFNQGVTNTPDDALLSDCIIRAETIFDLSCGTGYDQQTYSNVQAFQTWIDRRGWLHLMARERGPVTAVTAVQIRDLEGANTWQSVTFVADDLILPPFETNYPHPESWHVMLSPTPAQPPFSTGQLLARWSYTAGYASNAIPQGLKNLVARLAWWIYKLREAPVAKVVNMPLGTMTVPLNIPPDIAKDIELWRPVYS